MRSSLRQQRLNLFKRGNTRCPICLSPFTENDVREGRSVTRIPLTFQLTTRIRSASEWSVTVATGRLRPAHRWSAVIRCQNTGDGVRFRASH